VTPLVTATQLAFLRSSNLRKQASEGPLQRGHRSVNDAHFHYLPSLTERVLITLISPHTRLVYEAYSHENEGQGPERE
jgi:hypothetical protein